MKNILFKNSFLLKQNKSIFKLNYFYNNQIKTFSFDQQQPKDKHQRSFMIYYKYVEDMHYRRSKFL